MGRSVLDTQIVAISRTSGGPQELNLTARIRSGSIP